MNINVKLIYIIYIRQYNCLMKCSNVASVHATYSINFQIVQTADHQLHYTRNILQQSFQCLTCNLSHDWQYGYPGWIYRREFNRIRNGNRYEQSSCRHFLDNGILLKYNYQIIEMSYQIGI